MAGIFQNTFSANAPGLEMTTAKNLVFLIDDDASVRKGVARLLWAAGLRKRNFRVGFRFPDPSTTQRPFVRDRGCADAGNQRDGFAERIDSALP